MRRRRRRRRRYLLTYLFVFGWLRFDETVAALLILVGSFLGSMYRPNRSSFFAELFKHSYVLFPQSRGLIIGVERMSFQDMLRTMTRTLTRTPARIRGSTRRCQQVWAQTTTRERPRSKFTTSRKSREHGIDQQRTLRPHKILMRWLTRFSRQLT